MASVTRRDGARFVVPTYRDTIRKKTSALLKKEILNIATEYAAFVHLESKGPKEVEASFSPTAGYLLAETVWDHFDKPSDLIFCEELPDTNEVILIVIHSSSVYLDLIISRDGFFDELAALSTLDGSFEVRTFGDLPLGEGPQEGKFSFSEEQVVHFKQLTESVLQKLPCLNKYALRDVAVELSAHGIGGIPVARIMMSLVIIGILVISWGYFFATPAVKQTLVKRVDAYRNYRADLMQPAPEAYLKAMFFDLQEVLLAPGWSPTTLMVDKAGLLQIGVKSQGESLRQLLEWARTKHFELGFSSKGGMQLTKKMQLPRRKEPDDILKNTSLLSGLIDRVNILMVYKDAVKVGTIKKVGKITLVPVIVTFGPMSMEIFYQLIDLIKGNYQTFNSAQLIYQDGLVTGQIALTLLGD